jgi:hypothetical protein
MNNRERGPRGLHGPGSIRAGPASRGGVGCKGTT